jgi:hypothetical protein
VRGKRILASAISAGLAVAGLAVAGAGALGALGHDPVSLKEPARFPGRSTVHIPVTYVPNGRSA